MTRKTVLLTGATGNMGREAVKRIAARSDELALKVLVRREEAEHPVVRDILARNLATIAWGDLTDYASIEAAVKGTDVVLHVGGLVSPLADNLPPEVVTKVNVGGARNIVRAIHAVGDPATTRLVYIGTIAQTGSRNAPIHWGRTGDPIKISTYDHYAVTKTEAEAIVAESGLTHWVSLRQSGMAHFDIWKTFDPIIFHNPYNGVFEWSTANDSGRLMAAVCSDDVPGHFWRGFYNIGGGASSRVINHEFMATQMPNFRQIMRPHWSATRNFHGQWYADSDRLHELVPFREQSLGDFFAQLPRHMPALARWVPRVAPFLVRGQLEKLAKGPGGSLRWFADHDEAHINAYFGSRALWEAIPRDWDRFELAQPSRDISLLDHGYDTSLAPADWTISTLREAAEFRGGMCHAESCGDPFAPVPWECHAGHQFSVSPNLYLRGGHWCPVCQSQPANYDDAARHNPFFAQVWQEEGRRN